MQCFFIDTVMYDIQSARMMDEKQKIVPTQRQVIETVIEAAETTEL